MAERALPAAPDTYAQLKRLVEDTLLAGQRRIEQAKIRTYWEAGRHIDAHLFAHRDRAEYGGQVISRLSRDLNAPRTTLYDCLKFFRYFPIVRGRGQLVWTHYRLLCQIEDRAVRQSLEREAERRGWTAEELEPKVRRLNLAAPGSSATGANGSETAPAPPRPLTAKRGTPGLHPIVASGDDLVVDLGFKFYRRLDHRAPFKAGDITRLDDRGVTRADDATKADLFTYRATILRVIDGDTFLVGLDVGPETFRQEKLRLRGLDCPEMSTAEGRAAKRFVDGLLSPGAAVIVATTKPDKYDRYLADVFLEGADGLFLNNQLLAAGHATRKDAWEFGDWGL
ncbi:MAG TPA: DUF1016 N-terminal domain-containing protein [Opitutaceae bacterium]|nr:DUF1016 N-terminal domain-containing protein [Opitutaceae bacterium]